LDFTFPNGKIGPMAKNQAAFLKDRAEKFLANGKELLEKGIFDLAAFSFEQYCQLILKYYLFRTLGDFPKTHFLKELLTALAKASRKKTKIQNFQKENINVISNLENAYLTSRYLPAIFDKDEVENMLIFCQNLDDLLKDL
jgi:HEPN domain-containing protein